MSHVGEWWNAGLVDADFSSRLMLSLIHFLWQGCVIAGGVAVLGYLLQRAPASQRYILNLAGLLLMAVCVPATYSWLRFSERDSSLAALQPAEGGLGAASADMVSRAPVGSSGEFFLLHSDGAQGAGPSADTLVPAAGGVAADTNAMAHQSWMTHSAPYALGVYLAGVVIMFLRLIAALWGGWRLRRAATLVNDVTLLDMVARQAKRLGMAAAPAIAWCERVSVPMVVGIVNPLILLPASLATGLAPDQLESLLAHELAHIRRLDLVVNLLQRLFEAVLFFHPAVWYVSRRVSVERENACDDLVVSTGWQRVQYADALVRMAEICAELRGDKLLAEATVLAATGDSASHFKRRVLRLLSGEPTARLKLGRAGLAGLLLLFGSLVVAIWNSTRAQDAGQVAAAAISESDLPEETAEAPTDELTPAKIAEQMEATMQRFTAVDYAATFSETRDANAHYGNKPPLLVEGEGTFSYLSDGTRWFADERGFTVNLGEPGTIPKHVRAGFDGDKFFTLRSNWDRVVLGEHELADARLVPREIFWHGAKSGGWTLHAVRYFNARIDRRETIGGHECVVVVSEPGKPKPGDPPLRGSLQRHDWLYEITISPDQSWLPLKTVIHLDGKPYATETIEKLAQTPDGVWYPERIRFEQQLLPEYSMKKETRITRFQLRKTFTDDEFRRADPLPVGYDIVDYGRNRVWHNDPWWPELAPWLAQQLNWPRPNMSGLSRLGSNADGKIQGQPAPAIQAAEWLNRDPGGWDRAGRKLTVLMFLGGDAIDPTPLWVAGLKSLQELYGKDGLDVIGVATSTIDPAMIRRAIKSLDIRFPVAIDTKDTENNGYGRTFTAYGMTAYTGAFLIDASRRVLIVNPADGPSGVYNSQLESLIRKQLSLPAKNDIGNDFAYLSDKEHDQIKAEWTKLRTAKLGDSRLWVALKFPDGKVPGDGRTSTLRIVPELRLLSSSTPGGWTVIHAQPLLVSSDEGCDFFGLPKGTYVVTITRPGFASMERSITLPVTELGKPFEIQMLPGDTIRGQILDANEKPIAGARLKATKRHPDPSIPRVYTTAHLPSATVTTDGQGRFEFGSLFEGSYTFEVTADGYEPSTIPLVLVGTQDVKVALRQPLGASAAAPKKRTVRVRVVDQKDSTPIEGVVVEAERWDAPRNYEVDAVGTTDANGFVHFEQLDAIMYHWDLTAAKPVPYVPVFSTSGPDQDDVVIRLRKACELTLRAVDAETGQGIPGVLFGRERALAEYWLDDIVPDTLPLSKDFVPPVRRTDTADGLAKTRAAIEARSKQVRSVVTDAEGKYFCLVGPETWSYSVAKFPDGYASVVPINGRHELEIETPSGGRVEYTFQLCKGK